jgi:translation initiation factor 2B subunit (eIF-2B alpha/beta/delta family)
MLGASAVLSNGTVLSRAGSAAVAMTAHASSKPVLVCCEAFKVRLGQVKGEAMFQWSRQQLCTA